MKVRSKIMKSRFRLGASAAALTWAVASAAAALPTNPVIFDSSQGGGPGAATFTPSTGSLTIDQFHERVVIDWTSFDIAAGETVTFNQGGANWIAFNRVDVNTPTTIDGNLFGNGSVWIFSPAGLLFGPNANVNVGSFFAGIGDLDNFQANEAMGLSDDQVFINWMQAVNTNSLVVQQGAQITGTDFVILQGAQISMDGDVTSSGGVGFIVSEGGDVTFDSTNPSGLSLVDFWGAWDPAGRGQPSFSHGGNTTGAWIELETAWLFDANYQAVINLDGVVTATGVNASNNLGVLISVGDAGAGAFANGGTVRVEITGDIDSVGSIHSHAYEMYVGATANISTDGEFQSFAFASTEVQGVVDAAQYLKFDTLTTSNGSTVVSGVLTSGGDMHVGAVGITNSSTVVSGDLTADGAINVASGGDVIITGSIHGDADNDGTGGIFISPGHGWDPIGNVAVVGAGDAVIDPTAVIDGGAGEVHIVAFNGGIDMSGDITADGLILLYTRYDAGSITMDGEIDGGQHVRILVGPDAVDETINVSGYISAGAPTLIANDGAGGVTIVTGDINGYGIGVFAHGDGGETFVDGNLLSDHYVFVSSDSYTHIGSNAVIISDADDNDSGNALIFAGVVYDFDAQCMCTYTAGDLTIDAGASITGGGSAGVSLYAYEGDLVTAATISSDVAVFIGSGGATGGGNVSVSGQIVAEDFVRIYSDAGDISIEAGAFIMSDSDGADSGLLPQSDGVSLYSQGGGITIGDTALLLAGPSVSDPTSGISIVSVGGLDESGFSSAAIDIAGDIYGQDVEIEAGAGSVRVRGGAIISADDQMGIGANTYFVLEEGGLLTAGANPAVPREDLSWPYAPVDTNVSIAIQAQDMAIYGDVVADSVALLIDNSYGYAYLGGDGGGGNLDGYDLGEIFFLSNAEFQNVEAETILVIAGSDGDNTVLAHDADLTIQDLDIDSEVVDTLVLGTSAEYSVFVTGLVTVSQPGGTDLWIGGVADNQAGPASFIPGNIAITGSIGTEANPFGQVTLIAHGDIGMGSEAFLEEAYYNEDFSALEQSGDFPIDEGHIFIAAGQLSLTANGRIIQQNTSGSPTEFSGIIVGAPSQEHPLIAAPDALEGVEIGGDTPFTLSFAEGPEKVELFGVFLGQQNEVVAGRDAAEMEHLFDEDIEDSEGLQMNGCEFGGSVCSGQEVPRFETPTEIAVEPVEDTQESEDQDDSGDGDSDDGSFARSLIAPGSDRAYEQERMGEPITGSGNEDLWMGGGEGAQ